MADMEIFQTAYAHCYFLAVPGPTTAGSRRPRKRQTPDKADAVLKTGGTFVDCYRSARYVDGRGDWTSAQKVYADVVALAQIYLRPNYSWGVAARPSRRF